MHEIKCHSFAYILANVALLNDTKVGDLYARNSFRDLVAPGVIVFHKHILFLIVPL